MSIKETSEKMTRIIESCWDSNNPDDGLTFDERLAKRIADLHGDEKRFMMKVLDGCD